MRNLMQCQQCGIHVSITEVTTKLERGQAMSNTGVARPIEKAFWSNCACAPQEFTITLV